MHRHAILTLFVAILLAACDGDSSFVLGEPTPATNNEAVGGAWVGTDSDGNDLVALSDDGGQFRLLVTRSGEQGFGAGSSTGSTLTVDYTLVPPFGSVLFDGSSSASCSGSGTIQERQSLSISVACATTGGEAFNTSANFTYNSIYDRDSALSIVEGNYADTEGNVTSIAGDGGLFTQYAGTGCVTNGQVSVIDPQYNLYNVTFTFSNCLPGLDDFNGATVSGFALLDNTLAPEELFWAMTGDIGGVAVSFFEGLDRT